MFALFIGVLWTVSGRAEPYSLSSFSRSTSANMSERSDFNSFMRTLNFITEPGSKIQESPLSLRDIEQDDVFLMWPLKHIYLLGCPLNDTKASTKLCLGWPQHGSSKNNSQDCCSSSKNIKTLSTIKTPVFTYVCTDFLFHNHLLVHTAPLKVTESSRTFPCIL